MQMLVPSRYRISVYADVGFISMWSQFICRCWLHLDIESFYMHMSISSRYRFSLNADVRFISISNRFICRCWFHLDIESVYMQMLVSSRHRISLVHVHGLFKIDKVLITFAAVCDVRGRLWWAVPARIGETEGARILGVRLFSVLCR